MKRSFSYMFHEFRPNADPTKNAHVVSLPSLIKILPLILGTLLHTKTFAHLYDLPNFKKRSLKGH